MSQSSLNMFVSCIKVKGIHLLPPVITPERRLELQRDKQQAIKLEKRLQNCKELKKNLEELMTLHNITESPHYAGSSQVDLGITFSCTPPKRKPNLSVDILDISEYSNDGIKLLNKESQSKQGQNELRQGLQLSPNSCSSDAYDTDSSLFKSSEIPISSVHSSARDQFSQFSSVETVRLDRSELQNMSSIKSPMKLKSPKSAKIPKLLKTPKSPSPPKRLIRSNSYTLESPSPILLAHLKKWNKTNANSLDSHQFNLSRNWTSLENTFIPLEDSNFSSLNTVCNANVTGKVVSPEDLNTSYNEKLPPKKDTEQKSPTIEVVQTDISVQQITVNASSEVIEPIKGTLNISDPDCQLMQVLKKIPEDYSKQILELIEKQRSEHASKVENFGKQFKSPQNEEKLNDNDSVFSELSGWSNDYSLFSSSTQNVSPKVKEVKVEQNYNTMNTTITPITNEEFRENIFQELPENNQNLTKNTDSYATDERLIKHSNSSRIDRKFSFSKNQNIDDDKREWAANIICAHVKGFLTRKLLKTAKVQSLIDTIRDALLCALELHEIENIDEADIELHRRLINQVSAACYAFHDIFFASTVSEKMAIISADRKRMQLEKSRRSSSASGIHRPRSNSSRSSTNSFHSNSQTVLNF